MSRHEPRLTKVDENTLSFRERVRVRVGILMSLCELQAHERTSLLGSKIREFAITPSLITTG